LSFLGGFRSIFIGLVATFAVVFYLEGLLRTRTAFWLAITLILGCVLVLPFTTKLPLSVQRTISFLPIRVDGRPVKRDFRFLSLWKVQPYNFEIGQKEKSVVRIEKERKLLLSFLRPQKYRVYVNNQLVKAYEGY